MVYIKAYLSQNTYFMWLLDVMTSAAKEAVISLFGKSRPSQYDDEYKGHGEDDYEDDDYSDYDDDDEEGEDEDDWDDDDDDDDY